MAVVSAMTAFTALMLANSFATFRGLLDTRTSVAYLVLVCLVSSVMFLRLRGAFPWERLFLRIPGSVFDHAIRSSSK